MNTKGKIIRYDSPEAAQIKTVTGWVSSDGRFWGDDEHMARYCGCTHQICGCGEVAETGSKCDACCAKSRKEAYAKMPFKEWDGEEAVYSNRFGRYFFNDTDIVDFINESAEENDGHDPVIRYEDLDLIICEPNHLSEFEIPGDDFPEDQGPDDICSNELLEKLAELNLLIKNHPPISWEPGKYRTSYTPLP